MLLQMAAAFANAKQLSFGFGGIGSTPHMAGELFNSALGIRTEHIPYKGENPASGMRGKFILLDSKEGWPPEI